MMCVVAALLRATGLSLAAPASGDANPSPSSQIPVTDTAESLAAASVYQDSFGNLYVVSLPGLGESLDKMRIYVGDGKEMYLQAAITSSVRLPDWSANLWAPRARANGTAGLIQEKGVVLLTCRSGRPGALELVPPAKAKKLIATAVFRKPLHDRTAHVLARDDDGIYYFVDRIRDENENRGFRVFVGIKGAMKQLPMKNVVSDSAGEIFATKSGELKIITESKSNSASWRKGKKRTALTLLRPQDNTYLIARELGVYGRMGYVCDEQ